ncbi:hypothetical protein [Cryptosporangium aurantiacum]|uniref:Uncharacterized protein n=1 Tax=Cryptosporangium aurantiacum TaxID=134849 RepID=A0A1M7QVK8_9ACTN|nr:hypothetical protein [Cryptosporangium aurantiacum]SHN35997.1 hypothetical protein SAMN05443668_105467 [Cryptosporangium aurantiacum]
MSYDPNQPYGQQPSDPYGQPGNPYGTPSSGTPYNQPQSGSPYNQPGSGGPYGQPTSGVPYEQPPANPTSQLPPGDPYANPSAGAYGNPSAGAYGADPYAPPADPYANPAAAYGAPGGFPPPAPPKKSKTGIIVGGIVAVVVIIIAVCSVSTWLISKTDTDDTADPTPSAPISGLPSSGPTSAAPSAGPSIDTSRPEVAPAGAPFTTRLPAGFQEVTAPSSESTGASSEYTAAMATTATEENDFLILDSYTLPADTSTVSDSQLETEFDGLVRRIGQDPSTRQNVTYNGYKGYFYQFDFGTAKAYSYFMFNGTKEIQVRCQWADQESQIKTGCEYVLNNLQIEA